MAQQSRPSNYTQGYSDCTIATHLSRTVDTDAAFLLPRTKKTDHILDVGCGPGPITIGLAEYASEGRTVGLDISMDVLKKAKALAVEARMPTEGTGLPFPDETPDIVYCSQLFGHIPPPELPERALTEMRRVLKTGGILASRDGMDQHFYPRGLDVGRLMPALYRSIGLEGDGGKVQVGAGTRVFSGPEARIWLAWRGIGQLQPGDTFHQSWLDAGITEDEIQQTVSAVKRWAETEDAWYASLQCEILAWK
ncbi:S-adenosyl-L-methionine-dependent methyltransferase [Exophiala viscosa]|uniref:S-adenosyl-L-methionine-dependent methyltransferase n=1 Tax=Exophiala viscosa TaxID=2486360 RepID=UPI00219D62A2|nr:S-adenosyl-L-methionine-dependent methyltransferase [Exophiala viscosa]